MADSQKVTKKRKLFFPVGIISSALLPLLFLYYCYVHHAFQKYAMLSFSYLDNKYQQQMKSRYRFPPTRQFHRIELTGDAKGDQIKLDYLQLYIRDLITTKDTMHGIHLVLQYKATYASLVRAIDIARIENLQCTWMDEKGIWYLEIPPAPLDELVTGLSHCVILNEPEPVSIPWFQRVLSRLSVLKQVSALLFMFMGLFLLSFLKLITYLKPT